MGVYDWIGIAYYIFVTVVAIGILVENRNPMKTMSYILVLYLVPIGGLLIYFLFGQNYRKQKLFKRKGIRDNSFIREWEDAHVEAFADSNEMAREYLGDKAKVISLLINSDRSVITLGNDVRILRNGESTFEALMDAIRGAQHHIHIEYYIIEDDEVGRAFRDLLMEKAKSGVEVRLIYDSVGSAGLKRRFLQPLHRSGVEVHSFMPVLFPLFTSKANFRDHRKIVVVDGKVGFLGGVNLSARYVNDERSTNDVFWRDTHLRIEGDAVRTLQMNFYLAWRFVSDKVLPINSAYYPDMDVNSSTLVQVVASGPDSDWSNILSAYFTAINSADERIYITTPYFIPNEELVLALQTAAQSGIDVRLIIPARSDSRLVHAATMSYIKRIAEAGVRVYLYKKGFIHAKTMVVDGMLSTVGTANMDYRSFDINFEINAIMYDPTIATELEGDFMADLEHCVELKLERWERRKWQRKLTESFARLVAPLL